MPNKQNLIPQAHTLTVDEASKGGQNSAKARKEKKLMQQRATSLLEMSLHKGKKADIESVGNLDDLINKNISVSDAILLKQIAKALKGDTTAAAFLRDTAGQKPVEKVVIADVEPSVIDEVESMVLGDDDAE